MTDNQTQKINEKFVRLKKVIKELGYSSDSEFAKSIHMSKSYVSEILKSGKTPKTMGQKLEDHLGVSRKWFEDGEGEMSIKTSNSNAKDLGELPSNFDLDETPFIDLPGGDILLVFPLVTESAYAGYLSGYSDPEYIEHLPKHSIIVQKYHKGKYRGFEIVGDSMNNETLESIPDKSRVTGRYLMRHHWSSKLHIHRYKDFVIVHKTDGILAKRITQHDVEKGIITCHSLNPDKQNFPDFELSLEDVSELYNIIDVSIRR